MWSRVPILSIIIKTPRENKVKKSLPNIRLKDKSLNWDKAGNMWINSKKDYKMKYSKKTGCSFISQSEIKFDVVF